MFCALSTKNCQHFIKRQFGRCLLFYRKYWQSIHMFNLCCYHCGMWFTVYRNMTYRWRHWSPVIWRHRSVTSRLPSHYLRRRCLQAASSPSSYWQVRGRDRLGRGRLSCVCITLYVEFPLLHYCLSNVMQCNEYKFTCVSVCISMSVTLSVNLPTDQIP